MSPVLTARGPLEGRTVVVTRAAAQAAPLVALLRARGARVLEAPAIAVEPPPSWEPLDRALRELAAYRWVIFTSVNGVEMTGRRLETLGLTWADVAARRVAAIGPATATALAEHGVPVALVPLEYRAEGLVERLRDALVPGDGVLLPRAAVTRDVLVRELERLGARVCEVPAYLTRGVAESAPAVRQALAAGEVDAVTLTSSSTARHFVERLTPEERVRWLARVTIAAIGPVTAATLAEYGLTATVTATEYTIPGLVRALEAHFARSDGEGAVGRRS